jgi:hypothetical protein
MLEAKAAQLVLVEVGGLVLLGVSMSASEIWQPDVGNTERRCVRRLAVVLVLVGSHGCGGPDCAKLKQDLGAAVGAFVPVSSNACSSTAECTTVNEVVMQGGRVCWDGYFDAASGARAAELSAFLENDPGVAAACKAFLQGSCDKGGGPAVLGPAVSAACTDGQCVRSFP